MMNGIIEVGEIYRGVTPKENNENLFSIFAVSMVKTLLQEKHKLMRLLSP